METQVRQAIYDYTLTGTGLDATNVFWNLAPQDTAVDPVVVISIITNPQFRDTVQSHDEQFIQFSVFGKNLQECETLEAEINRLWDHKTDVLENLIDGNNKIAGLYRQHRDSLRDDKDYWHVLSRYKLELNSTTPNGFTMPEQTFMLFYPGLDNIPPQDNILIEFDLFTRRNYLGKPRPDGTTETYSSAFSRPQFLYGGGWTNDYFEMEYWPQEFFELYTNNVYIYHEIEGMDDVEHWHKVRIFIDFTTLPNATLTFEFNGQTWVEDLGEPQTIRDWDGAWNFMCTQYDTPRGRWLLEHRKYSPTTVLNPYGPEKTNPIMKFRNFKGDIVPKLETAYKDVALTQRAKAGEQMFRCECEKGGIYMGVIDWDERVLSQYDPTNLHPQGNFNDYNIDFWRDRDGYPYGGTALALFEVDYKEGAAGYGSLHGITTAVQGWQGCWAQFTAVTYGCERGKNIRHSINVYIDPINRKIGSSVRGRLFHSQVSGSEVSADFDIEVGKWSHFYMDAVSDKIQTQVVQYGFYVEVDKRGPISFWLDDVRAVQQNNGYFVAVL